MTYRHVGAVLGAVLTLAVTSIGCASEATPGESVSVAAATTPAPDVYQAVHDSVDQQRLDTLLGDMSGANPVTVGSETFTITNRYTPNDKANYRKYWTAYFQSLGLAVTAQNYTTTSGREAQGHNLEAILPGKVTDTVVVIVHYDSTGPHGSDNPGSDDDMTGMSILMETARILNTYPGRVHNTVRFVASDYEEAGGLEGARSYAKYVQRLAQQQHFRIVSAIDDEQAGWKEGESTIDTFDRNCDGSSPASSSLSTLLAQTATQYSQLGTKNGCIGPESDLYAMWEIGVPAVTYGEHDPFSNPHFDDEGGDTYDKIAKDYFFQIAQVGVTFSTRVVGIDP